MFETATKKFVRHIDPSGVLIPASSLNDSKNLQLLAVVLKSKKCWFWQRIKYRPTEFTLNNLLKEKKTQLKPECKKEEFVKYNETNRKDLVGSAEVGGPDVTLNLNGRSISKLYLYLGTLQKEYLDIPKLLNDTRGRKLDLKHSLIKQSKSKNKTFAILKERIFTTRNCKIIWNQEEKSGCHAVFTGCLNKMSIEGSGKQHHGSETKLDIPPDTVLAYSVMEISIDTEGCFELCLFPRGLDTDETSEIPSPVPSEVDGQCALMQKGFPLHTQKKALSDVQTRFCALSDLSIDLRSSILILLRKIMLDRTILSALADTLETLSSDEAPCFLTKEPSQKQSQIINEFLHLLKLELHENNQHPTSTLSISNGCQKSTANHSHPVMVPDQNGCHSAKSNQNGCSKAASKPNMDLIYAMQMLLCALEELTDAGLKLLEPFCTSERLNCLQDLVIHLTFNVTPLCKDTVPVSLQDEEEFHRMEELFKSCNVLLKKENDTITSEMACCVGFLPLVLCIAIHGLASLSTA
ncbi:gasdermin-E [Danio aesculapii]|uniref:gasdermin-E n=1 Tax=Danio aesculapii TaxID=1142201 RepID=UPI0024C03705|nr:gasdermin-E [Danio aesculapii]XP_056335054.1 gasdermin-E [Danio aesculapii]